MSDGPHHSIGEVLSLLKEEHPDITIAKIRFLESQGLIEPERTPSGYRKFYDADIERLRWILTQQRDNFLPLKVIKRRMGEAGFDPTSELPERDYGPLPEPVLFAQRSGTEVEEGVEGQAGQGADGGSTLDLRDPSLEESDEASAVDDDSATPDGAADTPQDSERAVEAATDATPEADAAPVAAARQAFASSSVSLSAGELAEASGGDLGLIGDLERLGLVVAMDIDGTAVYNDDDLLIASAAVRFAAFGLEARHLRMYRVAADREAGVLAQVVGGRLQKGGEAGKQAHTDLVELARLGESVHRALLRRGTGAPLPE